MLRRDNDIDAAHPGYCRHDELLPPLRTDIGAGPVCSGAESESLTRALEKYPVVMAMQKSNELVMAARILFRAAGICWHEFTNPKSPGSDHRGIVPPHFFIGGEYIGDSIDLFEEYQSGRLNERLLRLGINARRRALCDPLALLRCYFRSENSIAEKQK